MPCQLTDFTDNICFVYVQVDTATYSQNTSPQTRLDERCPLSSISDKGRPTLHEVSYFFVLPLDTLLALLSFICNSLIVAAVLRTGSIQRPSLLLLSSLSMTDVMWAIISLYKNIQIFVDFCPKEQRGPGERIAFATSLFSTLGNLAVISCDRLVALRKPLWYRTRVTRSHAIKQIFFVWLGSGSIATLSASALFNPPLDFVNKSIVPLWYVTCISTIIFCYVGILIANRRHRVAMVQYEGNMRAILTREKGVANTVGLIFIVLCFTFLPALVAPIVLYLSGHATRDFISLRLFYLLLVTLNGLLNPLLNYGRNEEVRRAVRITIRWQRSNGQRRINLNLLRFNNRVCVVSTTNS